VQHSCVFCLSALQGNKETLAIKIGEQLAKQKQKRIETR